MIEKLIETDKEFFLYLNSKHASFLDPLMLALSSYEMWWCVFFAFALLIWFNTKKKNWIHYCFMEALCCLAHCLRMD